MMEPSTHHITLLLQAWSDGDESAYEQLVPLVHAELHKRAGYFMRREREGHLLQTTALVNEAYIRLIEWQNVRWQDRNNFYGVAAMLMRRVLVDYARRYPDLGGRVIKLGVDDAGDLLQERSADLVALDDALDSLTKFDERKCRLVELRFFGGLTVDEAARILKISSRHAAREWELAKTWLYCELSREK